MMIKSKFPTRHSLSIKLEVISSSRRMLGFTLIELLIVISIIGLLSGISLFALQDSRKAGRDSKRKADLQTIASGLEIYKADCMGYRPSATFPSAGNSLKGVGTPTSCLAANIYIQAVPDDPDTDLNYIYQTGPLGCDNTAGNYCTTFKLWTLLEGGGSAPGYCGTAPDCKADGTDCNYCVVNP